METVRDSFVARFGEDQAAAIEAAAAEHENGVHDNRGSDPFKWAILIAVGYECVSRFAEHHGITVPEDEIREWAVTDGHLSSHDGDCDYLSAAAGTYKNWLPEAAG